MPKTFWGRQCRFSSTRLCLKKENNDKQLRSYLNSLTDNHYTFLYTAQNWFVTPAQSFLDKNIQEQMLVTDWTIFNQRQIWIQVWYFVAKIALTYCETKNCSNDGEKLLTFQAEGQEFAKFLRSLEWFIRTVKGQNSFL
mgnify:CR=1 FL=1